MTGGRVRGLLLLPFLAFSALWAEKNMSRGEASRAGWAGTGDSDAGRMFSFDCGNESDFKGEAEMFLENFRGIGRAEAAGEA